MRDHDISSASEMSEPEPRKRIKTQHSSFYRRPCLDWMVVSGNCHYARDRSSFCTYRPIILGPKPCITIRNNVFNPQEELQVAGVGTVELRVASRLRLNRDCTVDHTISGGNSSPTNVIVLQDVLHIPDAVCNGFNPLLLGNCSMSCHADYWEGADHLGRPLWYSTPFAGGTRLVLAEEPQDGESELIPGRSYTLSLYVSPEEKAAILFSAVAEGTTGESEENAMKF